MNESKLRGTLIRVKDIKLEIAEGREAEILLIPPSQSELKNLKKDDEVLVKFKIQDIYRIGFLGSSDVFNEERLSNEDIVAILPQEPKQEPKLPHLIDDLDVADPQLLAWTINQIINYLNKLREG